MKRNLLTKYNETKYIESEQCSMRFTLGDRDGNGEAGAQWERRGSDGCEIRNG